MANPNSSVDIHYLESSRKRIRPVSPDLDKPTEDQQEVSQVKARKRLRFDTTTPQEFPSRISVEDLDKPRLWWTREERSGIMANSRQTARAYRDANMSHVRRILDVFSIATQDPSEETSKILESATIHIPSEVRGLESGIAPSIKMHRRAHVEEVLQVQRSCSRLAHEMRNRLVGMRAMRSSRPSRVFSRIMGEGDFKATSSSQTVASTRQKARRRPTMIPTNW
jgi:hypothetical protein